MTLFGRIFNFQPGSDGASPRETPRLFLLSHSFKKEAGKRTIATECGHVGFLFKTLPTTPQHPRAMSHQEEENKSFEPAPTHPDIRPLLSPSMPVSRVATFHVFKRHWIIETKIVVEVIVLVSCILQRFPLWRPIQPRKILAAAVSWTFFHLSACTHGHNDFSICPLRRLFLCCCALARQTKM